MSSGAVQGAKPVEKPVQQAVVPTSVKADEPKREITNQDMTDWLGSIFGQCYSTL